MKDPKEYRPADYWAQGQVLGAALFAILFILGALIIAAEKVLSWLL
jgi:hypothetical protein